MLSTVNPVERPSNYRLSQNFSGSWKSRYYHKYPEVKEFHIYVDLLWLVGGIFVAMAD